MAKLYYSTVKIYNRLKKDAHDLLTVTQDGLMAKLTDLGFSKGIIFEAIVSTYAVDGTPNASAMGVVMEKEQIILMNMFNSSSTYRSLQANGKAVVNLTSKIEVFYRTALKEVNPNDKLPLEWFEKAETVNAPKLRSADATVDVSVIGVEPIGCEKTKVTCKVEQINATKKFPQVYCRAMSATLEAIIHATRVKAFSKTADKQQQVRQLLEIIRICDDVVNRTAPNSQYSSVMEDLLKRMESWRNKP